jgi:hypothetical protein
MTLNMALIRSFNILSRQKILISNQNVIRRHISDFGANLKPLKISYLGAPFDKGQVIQSLNLTIIDCLILFATETQIYADLTSGSKIEFN